MTFKILEASYALIKAIHTVSQDSDYGDPKGYYINVKVDCNGGGTGYYAVVPKPPAPFNIEELTIIENINHETLTKRAALFLLNNKLSVFLVLMRSMQSFVMIMLPFKFPLLLSATASVADDNLDDFEPVG